ncbi:class II histocompatibility antigen, B-L beta chain-like, partial [Neopelma chrysocephalum]|uniref:class II histocompatibility antigen, B-L beta chain-like n=1 Tax=Neopelma chrysocephalum TaxID=114329 RepID=UPI000FCD01B5
VFLRMSKDECHFINGTERVRYVQREIYNREQLLHFDSDVGVYVGDTPDGEEVARYWNSDPEWMEYKRSVVDRYCQYNYELIAPFTVERRGERGAERVPSAPAPGMTLEPLKPSLGITPDPSDLPMPVPVAFCPLPVHPSPSQSLPVLPMPPSLS